MSVRFQCGDGAALVGYLYDECEPADASVIAAHVATCTACAGEVRALQVTREDLRTWAPPEAVPSVRVVAAQPPVADVLRPARWWQRPLPAWAQAAAAVALFAAGAALGAARGAALPGTQAQALQATTGTARVETVSARDLNALEQRLRAEMARRDASNSAVPGGAASPVMNAVPVVNTTSVPARQSDARQNSELLLQQVRTLIRESEERQQRELTLRTAEVVKDVDAQRRGDLARIERTFGQMEGTTGVQVEQQRQMLNYLMRVSQKPGQ